MAVHASREIASEWSAKLGEMKLRIDELEYDDVFFRVNTKSPGQLFDFFKYQHEQRDIPNVVSPTRA